MDIVLLDIKSLLSKLESGQVEIEAGQWKLHKDLTNMKELFGEVISLKEDFDEMKNSNAEQLELIRGLEANIEVLKNKCKQRQVIVYKNGDNFDKVFKKTLSEAQNSKGYKERKSRIIRSEEIIEITSGVSTSISNKSRSPKEKSHGKNLTYDTSDETIARHETKKVSNCKSPQYRAMSHKDEMLERYLKDSMKYKASRTSKGAGLTGAGCLQEYREADDDDDDDENDESENQCQQGQNPCKYLDDAKCTGVFWDECSSHAGRDSAYQTSFTHETLGTRESVIPRRLTPSKCLRKVVFKREVPPKNRGRPYKNYGSRLMFKNNGKTERGVSKKVRMKLPQSFRCKYCEKPCRNLREWTTHSRKCGGLTLGHFNRK